MIFLIPLLANCSVYGRAGSEVIYCPQPAPSLLIPEPPLAKPGDIPAKEQREVLAQYAEDVGRFNQLREKHTDLQNWLKTFCSFGLASK